MLGTQVGAWFRIKEKSKTRKGFLRISVLFFSTCCLRDLPGLLGCLNLSTVAHVHLCRHFNVDEATMHRGKVRTMRQQTGTHPSHGLAFRPFLCCMFCHRTGHPGSTPRPVTKGKERVDALVELRFARLCATKTNLHRVQQDRTAQCTDLPILLAQKFFKRPGSCPKIHDYMP